MTWQSLKVNSEIHVLPIGDIRSHQECKSCWCDPLIDEYGIIIHHALDERELYEEGYKKTH